MKIVLYSHGGSMNHGCEALVRSVIKAIGTQHHYLLLSENPEEDFHYGIDKIADVESSISALPKGIEYLIYRVKCKLQGADKTYYKYLYSDLGRLVKGYDVALAIGGDNYCYKGFLERFGAMNREIRKAGVPTVLLGCSIEPSVLTPELIKDLKDYVLITARESITYKALLDCGLKNVEFFPDTAFILPKEDAPALKGDVVGVNVSPLIMKQEVEPGITMWNFKTMISYILENTDMSVALIPHVVWSHNDDRQPLRVLYDEYKDTQRVFLVEDCNAMQLKSIISKCKYMIAARTHASIAAYSTLVPTIVVGYSVKAHGIAMDLFGDDENYVISVNELKHPRQLVNAFVWLQCHEEEITRCFNDVLPKHKEKLKSLSDKILKLID